MEADSKPSQYIEITPRMRSFAFLRLQAAVAQVHSLLGSVSLYNEFPHTLKPDVFFNFAYKKYQDGEYVDGFGEEPQDYVMRLDLGRNRDVLNELTFLHLVNSFITYCSDILAVAALGSPEKFDLRIRVDAATLARIPNQGRIMREVAIGVVSHITFMSYPELKKLLLSKVNLPKGAMRKLGVVDRGVEKRNRLTHGLGISNLALDIHRLGTWRKREKVTETQLSVLWNAIAHLSRTIDRSVMKNFDVWRGVDICAPGLYRKKGGVRIRMEDF